MRRQSMQAGLSALAISTALLSACTQMPTEKQAVADIRPQVAFKFERPELAQALVSINGLPMGMAGAYRDGVASLRLVPGTHHLQVSWGGQMLLDERFYVADGVNKSFVLR